MSHRSEFTMTHPEVRTGMTAYTVDGEKLGTVERIEEDNITIEKGWFFHKDFLVSYDDIQDVREDQIILKQRRADFEERRTEDLEETREPGITGRETGTYEYGPSRGEPMSGYNVGREEDMGIPVAEEEEEVEVTKRPVVKEEVQARKETREEKRDVSGEVRKEDVKVEPSKSTEKK